MKNLHKKISAVILASMVAMGGIAASGVNAHASFIGNSKSLIGDYRGFIGNSPSFRKIYYEFMENVSKSELNEYKNVMEKIGDAYRNRSKRKYFDIALVGLPNEVEQKIKDSGYKLPKELLNSPISPNGIVIFADNFRRYYDENYIVRIIDNGKVYNFLIYMSNHRIVIDE